MGLEEIGNFKMSFKVFYFQNSQQEGTLSKYTWICLFILHTICKYEFMITIQKISLRLSIYNRGKIDFLGVAVFLCFRKEVV